MCGLGDEDREIEVEPEDEAEGGARKVKKVQDPREPTKEERVEHELTHLPYRSWCRHCVRGRGKQMPHHEGAQDTNMSEVHMDFAFLGREEDPFKTLTVLVAKERTSRMVMSAAVPRKTTGTYVAKRVAGFLREVGCLHGDMVVKSDQEPALRSVVEDVGRLKAVDGSGRYVAENSPVGASQSNGVIERAVQSVAGQVRVLLGALEEKWGFAVPCDHPLLPYVVEYAGVLLNRFEVGADGRTAYERNKGKKATTLGVGIGEAVLWRRKKLGGALGKLTSLWEDGIFLGIMGKSGELVIGDGKGVWKTRTVHRKPPGERWDPKTIELVRHPPWRTSDDDPNADGEMLKVEKLGETAEPKTDELVREELSAPRRVYIQKGDFEQHGYSARCPGCRSILKGTTRQGHTEACWARMEKALEGTERHERARVRGNEFLEEVLEREDKRRKLGENPSEAAATRAAAVPPPQPAEAEKRNVDGGPQQQQPQGPGVGSSGLRDGDRKRGRGGGDDDNVDMGRDEDDDDPTVSSAQPRLGDAVMVGEFEVNQEADDVVDDEMEERREVYDERTGELLDAGLTERAENEEMAFMEQLEVGVEASEEECWARTGKAPVTTKWVRVNKGTASSPSIRARLVARDFKTKGGQSLFAAMPPLEAKKLLFRMGAKERRVWRKGKWQRRKLMFVDVKKAHLNGKVPEDEFAYVRLPDGRVWRLKRWLYGMRPAAQAWEEDYAAKMIDVGFQRGKSNSTVFYRESTGCRCVVHGDDFTFLCYEDHAKELEETMREWYDLKVRAVIGDDDGDDKEVAILNRTLRHTGDGLEYSADPRHEAEIRAEYGVGPESKGLDAPAVKEEIPDGFDEERDDPKVDQERGRKYRGVAARANYLSQDRIDLQFAATEACRQMSGPRASGEARMKRIARYLLKYPALVWKFGRAESEEDVVDVFSDSDWAACRRSRRSTSGGVIAVDGAAVKHWSSTQSTVAMSVGEAEYYALVKAAAEGLAFTALARDLGYEFRLRLWVDSSTAKAIVSRLGLGKVRHMEVKFLWAQEAHRRRLFEVRKIAGDRNPADLLTKAMSAAEMQEKLESVSGRFSPASARGSAGVEAKVPARALWADLTDEPDDVG